MDFNEVLTSRRAVRDFKDEPLSRGIIRQLIDAAMTAPSAMNCQPWVFAALLDRKRIDCMAEAAKNWLLKNSAADGFGEEVRADLGRPGFSLFYHAAALILVVARPAAALPPGIHANEDCCLAAENLMLAARNEGIGSCWIGLSRPWLNQPFVKRELGLDSGDCVVAPIVLGFPTAWPEPHGRKPSAIHWL